MITVLHTYFFVRITCGNSKEKIKNPKINVSLPRCKFLVSFEIARVLGSCFAFDNLPSHLNVPETAINIEYGTLSQRMRHAAAFRLARFLNDQYWSDAFTLNSL